MNQTHELTLAGCTPEPLMSYLKSLGILRLVSEQADAEATACWRNDQFVLRSKFDEEGLIHFFLEAYEPTPIVGPWAGGSGFFGNDNRTALNAIVNSHSERVRDYQKVISQAKDILHEEELHEVPSQVKKAHLLKRYRREMPENFVEWMDAAMVLQTEGQAFAPVLGTGGNDGRLDFTQNFMQRIVELEIINNEVPIEKKTLLLHSLLGQTTYGLKSASVGQFSPGRAGGPNASQGVDGGSMDNPWDFILMLEGVLFLSGSVVRRLGTNSTDKAAFPFTVRMRPVGESSITDDELSGTRGELWLPLWNYFASMKELKELFTEGRAELSGKPAHDSIDFARSVAELGVNRGIRAFTRYGFLKRSGKAYLATAMDRFQVPQKPHEAAELFHNFDYWLDRFRRACSAKETPARLKSALRNIETAIFDYCRYGRNEEMLSVLSALGQAERELAVTGGKRGGKEICWPLQRLSSKWLQVTFDQSMDYLIALSLAGIYDHSQKIQPIRSNIEPVTLNGRWSWQEAGPHVVWKNSSLSENMAAVLVRRMMDGAKAGCDGLPLEAKRFVTLDAITHFIRGNIDDDRIEELLWGLILIDHRQVKFDLKNYKPIEIIPREYALLKLLFLPNKLTFKIENGYKKWFSASSDEEGLTIRSEPRILPLLRTGRTSEACQIAYQRLRSSGFNPLPGPKTSGKSREKEWEPDPFVDPRRLAAALLLPISDKDINQLINLVTRQEEEPESEILQIEGENES